LKVSTQDSSRRACSQSTWPGQVASRRSRTPPPISSTSRRRSARCPASRR
jgi:hypothetical protein